MSSGTLNTDVPNKIEIKNQGTANNCCLSYNKVQDNKIGVHLQEYNTIIGKLLSAINRTKFKRIVDKHKGDFAAKNKLLGTICIRFYRTNYSV